jgi:hypothetical protein
MNRTTLIGTLIALIGLIACNTNLNTPITRHHESGHLMATAVGPLPLTYVSSTNTASVNSVSTATRLTDNVPLRTQTGIATDDASSWLNPNPFAPNNSTFPMTATFDLGASKAVSTIEYFVGNISGSGEVEFVLSNTLPTSTQTRTAFVNTGNTWGTWASVNFAPTVNARYVMIRFMNSTNRFNTSELRVLGDTGTVTSGGTYGTQTSCRPTSATPCADLPSQALSSMALQALIDQTDGSVPAFKFTPTPNNDTCRRLHNRFWTTGPDGKAYPTWHPSSYTEAGVTCQFGHEHGDNPWQSAFYLEQTTFSDLWNTYKQLPVPFGYANQVLMDNPNGYTHRHEDHTGHKIFWEKFEITRVNMANHQTMDPVANRTNITCDGLVKIHMGSSTSDALVSHLHEMATHFRCTGAKTFRTDVTVLSPLSLPGSFTNTCNKGGTPGIHASVGANLKYPVLSVATKPMSYGSFLSDTAPPLNGQDVSGDRIIPQAACVHTYAGPAVAPNPRGYDPSTGITTLQAYFGHDLLELWTNPVLLTTATGATGVFGFSPYVQVLNPARISKNNDWSSTLANCTVAPTDPNQRSEACLKWLNANPGVTVTDNASDTSWSSTASAYNGTIRTLNLKKIRLNNTGPSNILSDAFGKTTTSTINIHQFVTTGINLNGGGVEPFDNDMGSLPVTGSNNVCSVSNGGIGRVCQGWKMFTQLNGKAVNGNQNAVEWFRDYSDNAGVHAPN